MDEGDEYYPYGDEEDDSQYDDQYDDDFVVADYVELFEYDDEYDYIYDDDEYDDSFHQSNQNLTTTESSILTVTTDVTTLYGSEITDFSENTKDTELKEDHEDDTGSGSGDGEIIDLDGRVELTIDDFSYDPEQLRIEKVEKGFTV